MCSAPKLVNEKNKFHLLEVNQRFSQSKVWQLQRTYFSQQGIQAWNAGTVPHYVTSNPFIANAYGKVIFGYLRDCVQQQQLDTTQPIYIVELGAGSGRFAYHFIKQFFEWYPHSALGHIPITYVMSDLSAQNLNFWRTHPFLQPFVKQGILDFAQFDIEQDSAFALEVSGKTLSTETLKNPLVVIANYFFDSIPHDIFHCQNGDLYETLVTLTPEDEDNNITDSRQLDEVNLTYTDAATTAEGYYTDPVMNQVLQEYQAQLNNTHLLFPNAGLQGLNTLRQISRDRLFLLSGDKGHTCMADLEDRGIPTPALHGSFSLTVNYHAIARYTQLQGGQALVPEHLRRSIAICGFLFGAPQAAVETRHAYQSAILHASPDDFFALKKALELHFDDLTLKQTLAYLRVSRWDCKIFLGCFDNLMAQAETASDRLCEEIYQAVSHIWQTYYFIGEEKNLPFHCAMLLYKMGYYTEAIAFLDISLQCYGDDPETLYNQAMCYLQLQSPNSALTYLYQALAHYPQFAAAQALITEIESTLQNP